MKSRQMLSAIRLVALIACSAALVAFYSPTASALTCTDIGGSDVSGDCTLSTTYECTGATSITIPGDLDITASGGIDCSGAANLPGDNLTIDVGGDMTLDGFITTAGGGGGTGGAGGNGLPGQNGGAISITVTGDVAINGTTSISAAGGAGGAGGAGSSTGSGGNGNVAGMGGDVSIFADGSLNLANLGIVESPGGAGGAGGAGGTINGNGGSGANGGAGGVVDLFSCLTNVDGIVNVSGGAGGAGGAGGGSLGDGGSNGGGGNAGTADISSGRDLTFSATAAVAAIGGNEGAVGTGNPPGADTADGGNGGSIVTNHCADFSLIVDPSADFIVDGGIQNGSAGTVTDLANAPCCPCQVQITKAVAPDFNCDGTPDGAFAPSIAPGVLVDGQCALYQICVANTADDGANVPQTLLNVTVDDDDPAVSGAAFGDIAPGDEVCKVIPVDVSSSSCPTGDCVCPDVSGIDTATVATATCGVSADSACAQPGSICLDTASVTCESCQVNITKLVGPDTDCNGVLDDGASFGTSATVEIDQCLVYQICVNNTGEFPLDASGVQVEDATLGTATLNFGQIASGDEVCKVIPSDAAASLCTGVEGTCICEDVPRTNTADITSALCGSGVDACAQVGSDCEDSATSECTTPACSVVIDKTVALDSDCNGVADNPAGFTGSLTDVPDGECVVYKICVSNTGEQVLDSTGVLVSDATLGLNLDFGEIAIGDTECQLIPGDATASVSLQCPDAQRNNTADITSAICQLTDADACVQAGSDCSDSASVTCVSLGCLTRTPGYWGNHPNVTTDLLPVESCGLEITTFEQAVQDLCESALDAKPNGVPVQELQLIRQCTAAMLNLSATAFFGGDCASVPVDDSILDRINFCCNELCTSDPTGKEVSQSGCIEDLDAFNNFSNPEDPIDTLSLCPNTDLGTTRPCRADSEQCQEANGDGIINPRP